MLPRLPMVLKQQRRPLKWARLSNYSIASVLCITRRSERLLSPAVVAPENVRGETVTKNMQGVLGLVHVVFHVSWLLQSFLRKKVISFKEQMALEHPRVQRLWNAEALGSASPSLLAFTSSPSAATTSSHPPSTAPYVPRTSAILHASVRDSSAVVVDVWMPDKRTGQQLVRVTTTGPSSTGGGVTAAPTVTSSTATIPSNRRIHAMTMPIAASGITLVADDIGNVFQLKTEDESIAKRHRTENAASTSTHHAQQWTLSLSASQHAPQRGCLPAYGAAGGWVGLLAQGDSQAICSREHFLDSRIFDTEISAIVKSIQHMHGPTALTAVTALGSNSVVFAEGPLLAAYDSRLPSAKSAVNRSSLPVAAAFSHVVDLGPQRPHEIATCSSDRSVIIWDVRNWTRVTTLSAVLKYATMSTTPLSGGKFLVCSGVDSEVRVCSTAPIVGKAQQQQPIDSEATTIPAVSSFRNRVNETEHCESTWHGSWTSDATGSVAIGMAITGEVYVARSIVAPSGAAEEL
ncbi:Hypothetical protein, putative [Bodo saltans]|uniref:Uncharacterized protein n=1 Tax=Bodo saltans TaxID=75058 RepID=A0A0S4JU63_BODSA|nr:Hypothetical protein, putative [Bodo saltans]|eukprot:CUG92914.1 Hypothetical protein, putative [Bodo saltans]